MNLLDPNSNPLLRARVFARHVMALIYYLVWSLIMFGSLILGFLAIRILLIAAGHVMRAIGI